MFSDSTIVIAILVIGFILLFDRAGKHLHTASPQVLKWVDYCSFGAVIATGFLIYLGHGGQLLRYLFFLSLIVYFIALRHTIYEKPSDENSPGEG